MENLFKMDDLGVPLFLETSICFPTCYQWPWLLHPFSKGSQPKGPDRPDLHFSTTAEGFLFIPGGITGTPEVNTKLGGGFKYFYFHPYFGKWSILTNIFQMGWNHQPEKVIVVYDDHPIWLEQIFS